MSKCQQTKEKVFLSIQGILERKYRLVTRLLCLYYRPGWKEYIEICKMAKNSGFRSSEAWIVLKCHGHARGYLLENILNLKVTGWEVPTNKDKNIDFTLELNSEEVYCEVKSPS